MTFLGRMNPLRAVQDLRVFLSQREKHELWFLMLAIVMTGLLIIGFAKDSMVERPYKRDIIYVEQWPLSRTDAEVRAQQAIDAPIKAKAIAEQKARQAKLQADFKKIDDKLNAWGL